MQLVNPIPISNINPSIPSTRTITSTGGSLQSSDRGARIIYDSATAGIFTIENTFARNEYVSFIQLGSGQLSLTAGTDVTLNIPSGFVASIAGQYAEAIAIAEGDGTFTLGGRLASA